MWSLTIKGWPVDVALDRKMELKSVSSNSIFLREDVNKDGCLQFLRKAFYLVQDF